ncbi:MAG: trypsin-like peptidase domain-containing protein [Deltaproteobacteria bacterium]|nr:trypsin-like peptidase domain-containing protein [Deltaproteobacteria bacterium]
MEIWVDILTGGCTGQRIQCDATLPISIGRRPECHVQLDTHKDLDVSGHHAEIFLEADGYYLYDKGSANGTFVGTSRVDRLKLGADQTISLGANGPSLRIYLVGAPQSLPAPVAPAPVAPAPVAPAPVAPAPVAPAPVAPQSSAAPGQPSAGQQLAGAIAPGGRVGARTVAVMIDAAVQQSRSQPDRGKMGRSTVFLRSMVNQAVTRSTSHFRIVVALMVVALVGIVVGFLVLRQYERGGATQAQQELRQQMATLMTQLNQKGNLGDGERQVLSQRLAKVKGRLNQPVSVGRAVAQAAQDAVYLMAVNHSSGAKGFCTAFAVRKRILATNAHCVVALKRFQGKNFTTYLVRNRQPTRRYRIIRSVRHPRYHKPMRRISEDVGVLYVDRDLPKLLPLADTSVLRQLDSGDIMFTYGFPGRLARVNSPNATLVQGIIGRLTKLDGDTGSFKQTKLLQHSAFTSGGTSGSPVMDVQGRVIAINAGSYLERGTMHIEDPLTGAKRQMRVAKQLSGYNFGIRIDVLRDILR